MWLEPPDESLNSIQDERKSGRGWAQKIVKGLFNYLITMQLWMWQTTCWIKFIGGTDFTVKLIDFETWWLWVNGVELRLSEGCWISRSKEWRTLFLAAPLAPSCSLSETCCHPTSAYWMLCKAVKVVDPALNVFHLQFVVTFSMHWNAASIEGRHWHWTTTITRTILTSSLCL